MRRHYRTGPRAPPLSLRMRAMRRPLLEPPLELDLAEAARRLEGVVRETPLVRFGASEPRVELRLKLECLQETGSFKARGAWNKIAQLSPAERAAGVVTVSSGNHGQALAWAAGARACARRSPCRATPTRTRSRPAATSARRCCSGSDRDDAERARPRARGRRGRRWSTPTTRERHDPRAPARSDARSLEQWPEVERDPGARRRRRAARRLLRSRARARRCAW